MVEYDNAETVNVTTPFPVPLEPLVIWIGLYDGAVAFQRHRWVLCRPETSGSRLRVECQNES